jgi:ATP-binding cassette subfamily F protein uup
MALIGAHDLSKSYGSRLLFHDLNFSLESGERVGLIGPNGAGKTTLLNILAGRIAPDDGHLSFQKGLKTGFLEQVPILNEKSTVRESVEEGLVDRPFLEDWEKMVLADNFIERLGLDPEAKVASLSGGWKKRVALARELVREPDLLFLDEPTNHLDVGSILWLEKFLANVPFATLTVTHDRLFLQRVSNRILELDRRNPQGILSVRGSYTDYLAVKDQLMSAQERRETILKNSLRRETEWLRRGPKARTTKQQARIQRAGELKDTVSELSSRNEVRTVGIDFQNSALPKRLLEAHKISKSYGKRVIFKNLNLLLSPGSRVGLLGSNGAGKSTLIRVLLGEETPDGGHVQGADQLQVAYFEQNRETLDKTASLARTLAPRGDHVEYRGQMIHIKSYLDRFLFTPIQMDLAVGHLSGGEQSRLLLAKLMLKPANLLVLDEPTNDLDMATLNVLQDCLTDFEGAILLVTHDRYFLDQVANRILAFPSETSAEAGHLVSFADLTQWEEWFEQQEDQPAPPSAPVKGTPAAPIKKKKLNFNQQREFDTLEGKIHAAEKECEGLKAESERPENAANAPRLTELTKKMESLKAEIDKMFHRWEELEKLYKSL